MRKPLRIVTFCMSLLVAVSAATHALCESDYVTIAELRESLPERWVGEYVVENGAPNQLEKGDTVSVDVPIVVPEVDAVPVVRITWDPPAEDLDKTLEWYGNTWSYTVDTSLLCPKRFRIWWLNIRTRFGCELPTLGG